MGNGCHLLAVRLYGRCFVHILRAFNYLRQLLASLSRSVVGSFYMALCDPHLLVFIHPQVGAGPNDSLLIQQK